MNKGNLHIHSIYSDGSFSVEELISMYKDCDFDLLSITDHDTMDGCYEAIEYGKKHGIRVLVGMEISTRHNGENVHILGYFNDEELENKELKKFIKKKKEERRNRCFEICRKLEKYHNIKIDPEKILKENKGVIGRPHIATEIVNQGYYLNRDEVFRYCLNDNSKAYIPSPTISLEEGINLIRNNNGIVILAHPVLLVKNKVKNILNEFSFDGIESIHSSNEKNDTLEFINIAEKRGLLITAGSDFHSFEEFYSDYEFGSIFFTGMKLTNFLNKLDEKKINSIK